MDDKNDKYLSHMKPTVEESGLNLDDVLVDPNAPAVPKKIYSGPCSCGSGHHVNYCLPETPTKREFCKMCKPENAVSPSYTTTFKQLKQDGFHILQLPNTSIPHHIIHSILYNKQHGTINPTEDPSWSTIFNNKFNEKEPSKRHMKKLLHNGNNNQAEKAIEALLTAFINTDQGRKNGTIFTVTDVALLMREEGLGVQLWHRDDVKEANGKFVIYPLSPNYVIYVIPKSHKLDESKEVYSDSAVRIILQPGQMFIGDSALVHAGGEVNSDLVPYVFGDGRKCFDIALHAYVSEGVNVNISDVTSKSNKTVLVDVFNTKGGRKENKPSRKLKGKDITDGTDSQRNHGNKKQRTK